MLGHRWTPYVVVAMAVAGDYLLVLYNLDGPELWHERLITAADSNRPGFYAVYTPDGDHYLEEISLRTDDVAGIRGLDRPGQTPVGLDGRNIYRFRGEPSAAELRQLLRDGALMLGVSPPAAATVLPPPGGVLPRRGRVRADQPPGQVWVAAEDVGGYRRGDVVEELGDDCLIQGSKGLLTLEGGDVMFIRAMPRGDILEFVNDDLRVLPVKFEAGGRRFRVFSEAVDLMSDDEPQGGLMLEGPGSILWLAQAKRDAGGSFTLAHEHWARVSNIPMGDRSVYEHEVISRVLDSMVCVDQLNVPALQSAELLGRRLQLIEEAHRVSPSAPDYTSADYFMGWISRQSGAAVAPKLRQHVADHLRGDAAIAKESRKAAEEATLRRQRGRKGGGRGSSGGAPDPAAA